MFFSACIFSIMLKRLIYCLILQILALQRHSRHAGHGKHLEKTFSAMTFFSACDRTSQFSIMLKNAREVEILIHFKNPALPRNLRHTGHRKCLEKDFSAQMPTFLTCCYRKTHCSEIFSHCYILYFVLRSILRHIGI